MMWKCWQQQEGEEMMTFAHCHLVVLEREESNAMHKQWQKEVETMTFASCLLVFLEKTNLMHQCWQQQEEEAAFVSCVCILGHFLGKREMQCANIDDNKKRRKCSQVVFCFLGETNSMPMTTRWGDYVCELCLFFKKRGKWNAENNKQERRWWFLQVVIFRDKRNTMCKCQHNKKRRWLLQVLGEWDVVNVLMPMTTRRGDGVCELCLVFWQEKNTTCQWWQQEEETTFLQFVFLLF